MATNWSSRRSSVYSKNGIVASSQPLASSIGVNILEKGGTAADAAVAVAAALNVTEPCSTGIGGDAFALYYDANTRKVSCLMGNGAAPSGLSLEYLNSKGIGDPQLGFKPLDSRSGLTVTVPGAAALWEDLVKQFGKLTMTEILNPAISLAENGFSVGPITAAQWSQAFIQGDEAHRVLRPGGNAPTPGELFVNPDLAQTFREVASKGAAEGFYRGRIARAIVDACQLFDGVLSAEDLEAHRTENVVPCSTVYKGYRVYETPPPTHGIAALIALNMMEAYHKETGQLGTRGSVNEAHYAIECMRLAFADALLHVADPSMCNVPIEELLRPEYARHRIQHLLDNPKSNFNVDAGDPTTITSSSSSGSSTSTSNSFNESHAEPFKTSETVYFCVIDQYGNGCSMINSNYMGFGTGIVPTSCGFTLQNRGHNFSLSPGHPNQLAPRKKPYHTIIPALVTRESDSSLFATLGVMGGFMQPQGHLQVIRNLIDHQMDPQSALDAPRWYISNVGTTQHPQDVKTSKIMLEDSYGGRGDYGEGNNDDSGEGVQEELVTRGHNVLKIVKGAERTVFGRGQIIIRHSNGILSGGSDPRADGCAIPCIFPSSSL